VSPRIEVRGLTGGIGGTTAFRDVDLAVDAGAIEALLGPNGAGKTTFLLTVAGFLPPRAGTVTVDGQALRTGRPGAAGKAGVVLVPDNRSLFTSLTVEENLRAAHRKGGRAPRELFATFPELERRRTLPAGSLSGGEQQMLAMARALIQRPRVLLVDEMSMGLAPIIVGTLFDQVRRAAAEDGCAVVLVEQHVNLALGVAQGASVLNRGEVVLRGAAGDLLADGARLEAAYLGATPARPSA
jgi:branched-chain amino acid transport system ATP-binding protein